MKTGKSISELAAEIQRQADAKRDYLVDTEALRMSVPVREADVPLTADDVRLGFQDRQLTVGATAHQQIGSTFNVPKVYYDRMLATAPGLLVTNVNWWMAQQPTRRLVRTLDDKARAFLSDRYRPMDNLQLAEAVLPVIGDMGLEVISADITERRMYLKAVDKSVVRELKAKGQTLGVGHDRFQLENLSPCISVSNSEIGDGSLSVTSGTFNHGCTNLAWMSGGEGSMKKYHIGGKAMWGEFTQDQVYALLSDKTRELNDAALWATVRDVVRGAFDIARFEATVQKLQGTAENAITGDVPKVVEVTAQRFGFSDVERKSVLDHLIRGGDLSQYGLHNAITRTAEDLESYDRASEFERIGGQVIELAAQDWKRIAEAA